MQTMLYVCGMRQAMVPCIMETETITCISLLKVVQLCNLDLGNFSPTTNKKLMNVWTTHVVYPCTTFIRDIIIYRIPWHKM